ncbi:hypothetical protein CAEBREN_21401 [Caenorhabditis brenneri]|uniref:Uncharacterized protein n=1 Tax=Caenorhabditis brenneri TaxID=135651 RepID=G0NWL6_CAEBE|nr:hypothetical protein CAEBREN_21401 [Caenorhabditis brenneri]
MRKPLLSIGLSQFGLSILQTLFMFYYVKVYLNQFHVSSKWFNIAQTLFMFWNTINDPLFGYLQEIRGSWLNNRLLVIKTLSPFLVGSFIFMWIPWSSAPYQSAIENNITTTVRPEESKSNMEGVHLILSLFLYDAFFSAIGVAWGALFADTTQNQPLLKVKALKYSQIAILVSASSIAMTEKMSNSLKNFPVFQAICFAAAILALICLWTGSQLGGSSSKKEDREDGTELLIAKSRDEKELTFRENVHNSYELTKQILSQRQFLAIVITNFFHTARSVAHMNFASIITDVVLPGDIIPSGSTRRGLFFLLLIIAPQIALIFNENLIGRIGAVNVAFYSYIASFLSGFMILLSHNPYLIMVFMFIDSITVHMIAPLFNILLSDFVDDDARKNKRPDGIASIIFSLNAVFAKPAQSIAPVIVVYFLDQAGYQNYLTTKVNSAELKHMMTLILFMTPLVIGGIQYLVLKSMYNFRRPNNNRNTHVI